MPIKSFSQPHVSTISFTKRNNHKIKLLLLLLLHIITNDIALNMQLIFSSFVPYGHQMLLKKKLFQCKWWFSFSTISNIILVKFLNCWYFSLLFFFQKQFKFHLVHFVIVVPIEFWCKNKRKTEKSVCRVSKQTRSENNLKHFMYFNIFLLSFCLTLVPARSCRLFLKLIYVLIQSKMRRKWEDRLLLCCHYK